MRSRACHAAWVVAFTLGAWGSAARADSAATRNNQGNRLYEEKRYDEALKLYTDAQATRPESPELHYNIGNVLFRKGAFDKAAEEYQRAQTATDPKLAQAAVFNRGNAMMMQGKVQDAINSYVQALRSRPDDQAAKRNLELALRLLEEQKKQQQEQQQQDKTPQPQDPRNKEKEQPNPSGDPKQDAREHPPRQAGEMTEEEARRILEALKEEERDGIRKHAQAAVPQSRQPEKDW